MSECTSCFVNQIQSMETSDYKTDIERMESMLREQNREIEILVNCIEQLEFKKNEREGKNV